MLEIEKMLQFWEKKIIDVRGTVISAQEVKLERQSFRASSMDNPRHAIQTVSRSESLWLYLDWLTFRLHATIQTFLQMFFLSLIRRKKSIVCFFEQTATQWTFISSSFLNRSDELSVARSSWIYIAMNWIFQSFIFLGV